MSFVLGVLLIFVGLVALVLAILTVVDAAPRPEWAFERAGTNKMLWIVLPIVGVFLCGVVAIVAGYLWFLNYRPKVMEAQAQGEGLA